MRVRVRVRKGQKTEKMGVAVIDKQASLFYIRK